MPFRDLGDIVKGFKRSASSGVLGLAGIAAKSGAEAIGARVKRATKAAGRSALKLLRGKPSRRVAAASVLPTGGHRGIAAGSLKRRQKLQREGKQPFTREEIARWEMLSGQQVEDFIKLGRWLRVHSSNVWAFKYDREGLFLYVQFKRYIPKVGKVEQGGAVYEYGNVDEALAVLFATAQSKGGATWDYLRVRGSRTAHQKPYRKILD